MLGITLRIDEIHSDLINRFDSNNARIDRLFEPAVTKYEHGKMDPQAPGIMDITKPRPPPKRAAPAITQTLIDDSFSQLPASDNWLYIDREYPEVYTG